MLLSSLRVIVNQGSTGKCIIKPPQTVRLPVFVLRNLKVKKQYKARTSEGSRRPPDVIPPAGLISQMIHLPALD